MCCKDPLNGTIQDGYRHKLKTNQQKQQNKASEDGCVDTAKTGKTVSDAPPLHSQNSCSFPPARGF